MAVLELVHSVTIGRLKRLNTALELTNTLGSEPNKLNLARYTPFGLY
jgi:hypothetical protein